MLFYNLEPNLLKSPGVGFEVFTLQMASIRLCWLVALITPYFVLWATAVKLSPWIIKTAYLVGRALVDDILKRLCQLDNLCVGNSR